MRRLVKKLLPFTTAWGAAAFAWHHREPIIDWTKWAIDNAPRVVEGEGAKVWKEAKARASAPERGEATVAHR